MERDNYEKDVIGIEETLAIQQHKMDELGKLSTDVHDRNTLLEEEVQGLKKRLNTAKLEVICNMIINILCVYYCI